MTDYRKIKVDGKQVREHIAVATRAFGRPLPKGVKVHHADGNLLNNKNANLVICPNDSYHQLLHRRMRALDVCGNANWIKCWVCKAYDAPENIVVNGKNTHHSACINEWQNAARARRNNVNIIQAG